MVALRETYGGIPFSWDNDAVPSETQGRYEERLELDEGSVVIGLSKDFMSKVPFIEG